MVRSGYLSKRFKQALKLTRLPSCFTNLVAKAIRQHFLATSVLLRDDAVKTRHDADVIAVCLAELDRKVIDLAGQERKDAVQRQSALVLRCGQSGHHAQQHGPLNPALLVHPPDARCCSLGHAKDGAGVREKM